MVVIPKECQDGQKNCTEKTAKHKVSHSYGCLDQKFAILPDSFLFSYVQRISCWQYLHNTPRLQRQLTALTIPPQSTSCLDYYYYWLSASTCASPEANTNMIARAFLFEQKVLLFWAKSSSNFQSFSEKKLKSLHWPDSHLLFNPILLFHWTRLLSLPLSCTLLQLPWTEVPKHFMHPLTSRNFHLMSSLPASFF